MGYAGERPFVRGLPAEYDPATGEIEVLAAWQRDSNGKLTGLAGNDGGLNAVYPAIKTRSTVQVSIIQPAATFVTLTISDNSGDTQITSDGVHGLTTSPAAGKGVYVTWAGEGHTGVDGIYTVLTVDSTKIITIDLPYDADLGTPTVAILNTEVTLASFVVAGGTMGAQGGLEIDALLTHTNSAGVKTIGIKLGGTAITAYTGGASNASTAIKKEVFSRGETHVLTSALTAAGPGSAGAMVDLTLDTTEDRTIIITAKPADANEYIALEAYSIVATYAP